MRSSRLASPPSTTIPTAILFSESSARIRLIPVDSNTPPPLAGDRFSSRNCLGNISGGSSADICSYVTFWGSSRLSPGLDFDEPLAATQTARAATPTAALARENRRRQARLTLSLRHPLLKP